MKTNDVYFLMVLIPFFSMCRNAGEHGKSSIPTPVNKECFLAIDGKDSAFLSLNKGADSQYTGHLKIDYVKQPDDDGNFGGSFIGDTLFVNYSFYLGKDSGRIFTNPLALLKRGDSLILGSGKILSSFGRSYLKKSEINFEKGRFRFVKVPCR